MGKSVNNQINSLADKFINALLKPVGYQNLPPDVAFPFDVSEII